MTNLNDTHDVNLRSWVHSANREGGDFPIQNLPFAVFRRAQSDEAFRGGVAIGDQVLDIAAVVAADVLRGDAALAAKAAGNSTLNEFMGMGKRYWSALRGALSMALREGAAEQQVLAGCLVGQADVEYSLPCRIGDYTDFYTSIYHATSVGKQFRPDNPLLPNYKWIPIGYHGRSSSIVVSGHDFHRPVGQLKAPDADAPAIGPCKRLDHELELGIYIGSSNELGESVSIDEAEDHVFGICLFNDWSARDIQGWEYQPLGPFLAKNFVSSVAPWIVTMEALEPYRSGFDRPADDPQPLDYLSSANNSARGGIDISLQALLQTQSMRSQGVEPEQISSSSFKYSYWTVAQMVTHHTVNGCNLQPGDLLGSGTQSGPNFEEAGSMLELSRGGKTPLQLSGGETRAFLEDGDAVVLRGHCQRDGAARIGFGEVVGTILPAKHPAP